MAKNKLKVPVFARGGDGPPRKRGEIPDRPLKQGQVWGKLRDAFQALYRTGHIVRIENGVGPRGMPDVYYRMHATWGGWLEIKTGYQKPTALQLEWHAAERTAGGAVVTLTIRSDCAIMDFGSGPENMGILTWAEIVAKL